MGLNKLFALNKHAAGSAAGVKNSALKRFNHGYKQLNYASWSVELPALLALSIGELTKEVLVNSAKDVFTSAFLITQANRAN